MCNKNVLPAIIFLELTCKKKKYFITSGKAKVYFTILVDIDASYDMENQIGS